MEKWPTEHPQKTMLQDFLEKYPNAEADSDGTPKICPHELGYTRNFKCCAPTAQVFCEGCWNHPAE